MEDGTHWLVFVSIVHSPFAFIKFVAVLILAQKLDGLNGQKKCVPIIPRTNLNKFISSKELLFPNVFLDFIFRILHLFKNESRKYCSKRKTN
jgi:hypothetical protein